MAGPIPQRRMVLYGLVFAAGLGVWLKLRPPSAVATPTSPGNASMPPAPAASASPALPAHLSRPPLQQADWNPFAGWTPPPPPPPPPVKVAPTPPPPPSPPPLDLSFVGRMTAPDGKESIFVLHQGNSLQIAVGQTLPNGYVVKAITPRAVEFDYPPMNTTARLELPEPPRHETR